MDKEKVVIGVDVGGTKIRYGIVGCNGSILFSSECPSQPAPSREWFSFLIGKLDPFLEANLQGKTALAIGLGIRGSMDHKTHRIRSSSMVFPDRDFDLCGALSDYYHMPVFIENDVKASAISELLYGEGKNTDTFACINVGTGLAMGLVYEGRVIYGIRNNAGEIGNLLYRRQDDGEIACIETLVSGMGIRLETERLEKEFPQSRLPREKGPKQSRQIIQACRKGDPLACKAVQNFIQELAMLIINLENALDIGSYVFVGGVMSDPWIFQELQKEIQRIAGSIHYGIFHWDASLKVSDAGAGFAGLRGAAGVAVYGLKNPEG